MEIIFVLIPIALIFVSIAVYIFFWAVKSDQFEDLEREGSNILFDDMSPTAPVTPVKDAELTPPTTTAENSAHDNK